MPSQDTPQVSVIIPCFQQGRLLPRALDSVLAQTGCAFEIIIVNDGSTDDTSEVARAYLDRHPGLIRLHEQPNQGQAAARAAGFALARGEFLVLLDADDILHPGMFQRCLGALRENPRLAGVTGDASLVDAAGNALRPWPQRHTPAWPDVLRNNPFGVLAAVMTRTGAVRRAGGLAVGGTPGVEDWDMWARLARCGMQFGALRQPVAAYCQTPGSTSRKAGQMLAATIELLERCRAEDPRLAGAGPVAPPIPDGLYQELRNGKVFKALGLAISGETGAGEIAAILDRITPGVLNPRYCRDQFLEGIHYGFFLQSKPGLPPGLDREALLNQVTAALQRNGLDPAFPRHRSVLALILNNPLAKRSLLARLRDRLFS